MRNKAEIVRVHPSRIDFSKGDITSSYSADRIPEGRIRDPFEWNGSMMVCTGSGGLGAGAAAEAYKLVPLRLFGDKPTTYYDKGQDDNFESARNDPMGFYHGMTVKWRGEDYALVGPEIRFVGDAKLPGPVEQLDLL